MATKTKRSASYSGKSPAKKTPANEKSVKIVAKYSPDKVYQMIQVRAFEIYVKRGNRPGDHLSDWTQAEKQVKKELGYYK